MEVADARHVIAIGALSDTVTSESPLDDSNCYRKKSLHRCILANRANVRKWAEAECPLWVESRC